MAVKNTVCRRCRREGMKLMLKGERCFSPKCGFTKRSYAPGQHGQARRAKVSDYGHQLREKQKAKIIFDLREQQFRNYFNKAAKTKKSTGERLLQLLVTRLDYVVYLLGFAPSVRAARQMVRHGHIKVNSKNVSMPSFRLKAKDVIVPKDKNIKFVKTDVPIWLKLDKKNFNGEIVKIPERSEISTEIDEGMIVEFYSR